MNAACPGFGRRSLLVGFFFVVSLSGCGGDANIYPVEGTVLDLEGQPIPGLAGASIEFESVEGKASAIGTIDEAGRFRLTTKREGDGAWLGKHKVLIAGLHFDPDTPVPRVILAKYETYETSGLEAVVKAERNHFVFKMERVRGKK